MGQSGKHAVGTADGTIFKSLVQLFPDGVPFELAPSEGVQVLLLVDVQLILHFA